MESQAIFYTILTLLIFLYILYELRVALRNHSLRSRFKADFAPDSAAWPFGLDYVEQASQAVEQHNDLEFFRTKLGCGRTHGARILGRYLIFTNDSENIKAILATQFYEFGKGPIFKALWQDVLGDGIFNADGSIWAHSRALLKPHLYKERYSDLTTLETKLAAALQNINAAEGMVDFHDLWLRFMLDVSTAQLFGVAHGTNALSGDDVLGDCFAKVQAMQMQRSRQGILTFLYPLHARKFRQSLAEFDALIYNYVDSALSKGDLAEDSLLQTWASETPDRRFLRDNVVSVLLAGRDTTASLLTWATKELADHPKQWESLRNEVQKHLGAKEPSYQQLKSLPFLQAILKETLRLYPAVPFNARTAFCDTTLPSGGGIDGRSPVLCPAGTQVVYSAMALHRDTVIEETNTWIPERWLAEHKDQYRPPAWSYLPFNGGARTCLGQNFALTVAAYALTRLAQTYSKLEPENDGRGMLRAHAYKFDIILTPRAGCRVKCSK